MGGKLGILRSGDFHSFKRANNGARFSFISELEPGFGLNVELQLNKIEKCKDKAHGTLLREKRGMRHKLLRMSDLKNQSQGDRE